MRTDEKKERGGHTGGTVSVPQEGRSVFRGRFAVWSAYVFSRRPRQLFGGLALITLLVLVSAFTATAPYRWALFGLSALLGVLILAAAAHCARALVRHVIAQGKKREERLLRLVEEGDAREARLLTIIDEGKVREARLLTLIDEGEVREKGLLSLIKEGEKRNEQLTTGQKRLAGELVVLIERLAQTQLRISDLGLHESREKH